MKYQVNLPYVLRGHLMVSVDANSAEDAQDFAVAAFHAGEYDEDIGLQLASGPRAALQRGDIETRPQD